MAGLFCWVSHKRDCLLRRWAARSAKGGAAYTTGSTGRDNGLRSPSDQLNDRFHAKRQTADQHRASRLSPAQAMPQGDPPICRIRVFAVFAAGNISMREVLTRHIYRRIIYTVSMLQQKRYGLRNSGFTPVKLRQHQHEHLERCG